MKWIWKCPFVHPPYCAPGLSPPVTHPAAAKAADKLLTVEHVEASFALVKIEDRIHISARSTGKMNVQLILEQCGGGGHFDAAAAQLSCASVDEALRSLKEAIDAYLARFAE